MSNDDFDTTRDLSRAKRSASSEMKEAVLKSLKPRAGKGTTKWLAEITQEALEEPSAASAGVPEQAAPPAPAVDMMTMVDKLFDVFTGYSFEFNRSVGSRELNVDVERPTLRKAGDARYGQRAGASFCGRLFMRQWSLMIRGEQERIEGALVPSDQILAYNADPSEFAVFFGIELSTGEAVPVWRLNNRVLQVEDLRTLAKQLLVSLVRFAKGELEAGDQFVWTGDQEASPALHPGSEDTPMPGAQLPPRPPSFYSDGESSFFSSSASTTPSLPESRSPQPAPPAADSARAQQPAETSQKALSVAFALGLLEEAVAKELDKLAKSGAKAFEAQDLAAAEKNLKQTGRVKNFREKIESLRAEWESLLNQ